MDGKLCSNASAGKAPEATLAAALILSFFLRITGSMPAPSRPLHRGNRTIAVDKSCHLPLWKQVPRLQLCLSVEANVVRLAISLLATVMNKAQFLADLKDPTYRATLITNEGMRVFSYQDMAIVIGRYHTKGSYKRKPFEHYGRFTDTWVYQDTMWRCVASHTSLIEKK